MFCITECFNLSWREFCAFQARLSIATWMLALAASYAHNCRVGVRPLVNLHPSETTEYVKTCFPFNSLFSLVIPQSSSFTSPFELGPGVHKELMWNCRVQTQVFVSWNCRRDIFLSGHSVSQPVTAQMNVVMSRLTSQICCFFYSKWTEGEWLHWAHLIYQWKNKCFSTTQYL